MNIKVGVNNGSIVGHDLNIYNTYHDYRQQLMSVVETLEKQALSEGEKSAVAQLKKSIEDNTKKPEPILSKIKDAVSIGKDAILAADLVLKHKDAIMSVIHSITF